MTPRDVDALSPAEYRALRDWQTAEIRERERQLKAAKRRS